MTAMPPFLRSAKNLDGVWRTITLDAAKMVVSEIKIANFDGRKRSFGRPIRIVKIPNPVAAMSRYKEVSNRSRYAALNGPASGKVEEKSCKRFRTESCKL